MVHVCCGCATRDRSGVISGLDVDDADFSMGSIRSYVDVIHIWFKLRTIKDFRR